MSYFHKLEMASEQLPELRIVLIGKVGAGKTGLMNTILRSSNKGTVSENQENDFFHTETCHMETVEINNQKVVVVDTPGLCRAGKTREEVMKKVKRSVSVASPGPHAFLFVLKDSRFDDELQKMVEFIWETFGENAAEYALVVFTHKNELESGNRTVDDFIQGNSQLEQFVSKCGRRVIAIENTVQDSDQVKNQVTDLLNLINDMVKNNVKYYTIEMLQKCQSEAKGPETRENIKLVISICVLVGAAGGFVASYFVGNVPQGAKELAIAGAAVGGVIGCVGIVAFKHIKDKICSI